MLDAAWYCRAYPDVAQSGLPPALHYLKYGAELGRDPAPGFETLFYLQDNPDVAAQGDNPLLHYALHGRAEGRPGSAREKLERAAVRRIEVLREALLSLGLEAPLAELAAMAATGATAFIRALAARELALWELRSGGAAGAERALGHLAQARLGGLDPASQGRLTTVELLALHRLGRRDAAAAVHDYAGMRGRVPPDAGLVMANFEPTAEMRCAAINRVLAAEGLAPLALAAEARASAYDRLEARVPAAEDAAGGPLVSVLVAACNAARTLPTALRALQQQSWRNLEILVIDDASTDGTRAVAQQFAARDRRIRLISLPENVGAYRARNHGLAVATGAYVTLHDADDWAHPLRIETQLRHLEAQPEVLANTTAQARMREDLSFARWTGRGDLIVTNLSSLMFRRVPVQARLGFWDEVRVSADHEMIRRMRHCFGPQAVVRLPGGPLAFQRDREDSAVGGDALGIAGVLYGARREYRDAQLAHHAAAADLRYERAPEARPFPVPRILLQRAAETQRLPLVLAGDFRRDGPGLRFALGICGLARAAGLPLALVDLFRFDPEIAETALHPRLRAEVDGRAVHRLCYGEKATCELLLVADPRGLAQPQRYRPEIAAARIHGIVPEAAGAEDLAAAATGARDWLGAGAEVTWHPVSGAQRARLAALPGLRLAAEDWPEAEAAGAATGDPLAGAGQCDMHARHLRDAGLRIDIPLQSGDGAQIIPAVPDCVPVSRAGGHTDR